MRVADVTRIDACTLPDCCITCQELYIKMNTLACNLDGVDTLPLYKCQYYKRLRMYGTYGVSIPLSPPIDTSISLQTDTI